jgi:uncharacterized protein YecE (DUF72 family)
MTSPADIRIGISGWQYEGWEGTFYPEGLSAKKQLPFAAQHVNSIELNGSFYSLQKPPSFKNWSDQTPENFVFSIKAPRFITHIRRLVDCESPVANFCAQGILRLGKKLGPILWQLPPSTKFDAQVIDSFCRLLPHTHAEAARIAANHDRFMNGRAWLELGPEVEEDRPMRHAIEVRHKSFACEEYIAILRKHGVAAVVADTPMWPRLFDITADFMYCRLHGSEKLYSSGYTDQALDEWAQRVLAWSRGQEVADGDHASAEKGPKQSSRDIFVYFDNDQKVRSPFDAQSLQKKMDELKAKT